MDILHIRMWYVCVHNMRFSFSTIFDPSLSTQELIAEAKGGRNTLPWDALYVLGHLDILAIVFI